MRDKRREGKYWLEKSLVLRWRSDIGETLVRSRQLSCPRTSGDSYNPSLLALFYGERETLFSRFLVIDQDLRALLSKSHLREKPTWFCRAISWTSIFYTDITRSIIFTSAGNLVKDRCRICSVILITGQIIRFLRSDGNYFKTFLRARALIIHCNKFSKWKLNRNLFNENFINKMCLRCWTKLQSRNSYGDTYVNRWRKLRR